jgi:hypothetical protein
MSFSARARAHRGVAVPVAPLRPLPATYARGGGRHTAHARRRMGASGGRDDVRDGWLLAAACSVSGVCVPGGSTPAGPA